ncbi:MAG: alpha/beta fold hydrolase, partial [Planctomycetota bacterium]
MNGVWSATGIAISTLTRLLRSRLRASGHDNLPLRGTPCLFVANHFTRFETVLIPYLLYQHDGRVARSLADRELFGGTLGNYLRRLNAFPTNDPTYKRRLVRDLARGSHDWVIYPEGGMVKHKRVRDASGALWLRNPWREGPPHTGAAVFALRAELLRQASLGLLGDEATSWAQQRIGHRQAVAHEPVHIVPVTFTYYPMRPGDNALASTIEHLCGDIHPVLREELLVEGQLLLGEADIGVHFGTPLPLYDRVRMAWRRHASTVAVSERPRALIDHERHRLTHEAMLAVYHALEINTDHILVTILRRAQGDGLSRAGLIRRAYLAATTLAQRNDIRLHPRALPILEHELCQGPHPQVDSFLALGSSSNALSMDGTRIRLHHDALDQHHGFHHQRLRNPLAVIAAEIIACPGAAAAVARSARLDDDHVHHHLADLLHHQASHSFTQAWYQHGGGPVERYDVRRPRLLRAPQARVGVALCHGYLAAPAEVAGLGARLHRHGFSVYLPRLPGHATRPEDLLTVHWQDWVDSYRHTLALLAQEHDAVISAGFSLGGLIALHAAADCTAIPLIGAVAINAPRRLLDRRLRYVPLVRRWRRAAGLIAGPEAARHRIDNPTESPSLNYHHHYLHSVNEVLSLTDATVACLNRVSVPCLLIQGDR